MKRFLWIILFFITASLMILFRLFYLQVYSYDELSGKADARGYQRVELTETPRGAIWDCNGISITASEKSLSLLIVPLLVDDAEVMAGKICNILPLSAEHILSQTVGMNETGEEIRKQPFIACTGLSETEAVSVENLNESGVCVVSRNERYRNDDPAQHLLGMLGRDENNGMSIGISGLEKIYNEVLSAENTVTYRFPTDERGRMIDPDEYYRVSSGSMDSGSISTTIDLEIQRAAESALGERSGAVVVMDSRNGDILALASSPKYDPLRMTELASEDVYINKALSAYPPASLFKIFVSAVVLEEHIVAGETSFYCDGSYPLDNGNDVGCWKEDGHGLLTFDDALAQSCNPVYVRAVLSLGERNITEAFEKWELDRDILLGYPLDDRSSLDIVGGSDAVLANIGLGESGVMMTPLNVAKMINVIAADGMLLTPRVVTLVKDEHDDVIHHIDRAMPIRVVSEGTADIVTEMMVKTYRTGTAKDLRLDSFALAGKTGTSETGNVWIGGFFPYDEPRFTVVVLVTDGTSGVGDAGPVMRKLCAYLGNLL